MAIWGRKGKHFEPSLSSQAPEPQLRAGDLTVSDYANGMPNIRLSEMFKSLMRQMGWFIPLALIGCAGAWYLTKDLKRTYTGDGRILVQLGEEYVYNPVGKAATGNGLMTTIDTITLTEAAIMKNGEIMRQVVGELTPDRRAQDRFDKKAFEKIRSASNERARQDAWMELFKKVETSYAVMPQPKSSIIDVVYKHENPDVAVEATNAFIDAYLSFRRQVFVEGSGDIISERREATEEQLTSNERAIARFLSKNDVSDFESEQTGLRKRTEDLKAALNTTRASIAETEASLALVEDQLRGTPETIDLYRDDRTSQRVAQAELELRQLMAKYLPTSDPVRRKQTELNELRELQNSYGGQATGGRRVGPNPVQQALLTQRNTLAATADSLREKEFTLQRQLNSADAKVRRLTKLSPEYQNLLRERVTLNARLTSYNAREQEALVDAQQAQDAAENVKVISRPEFANKGRNMQKLMWFAGTLAWAVFLGFIALMRIFLDPRLYAVPAAASRQDVMDDPFSHPAPVIPDMPMEIPESVPAYAPAAELPQVSAEPELYADNYAYGVDQPAAYAQPQGSHGPYAQPYQPAPQPQTHVGNTALDVGYNPYMSNEVQAALTPQGQPPYPSQG
jgi:uncharacterized protein involved in exopolysaccharide biosynthesis